MKRIKVFDLFLQPFLKRPLFGAAAFLTGGMLLYLTGHFIFVCLAVLFFGGMIGYRIYLRKTHPLFFLFPGCIILGYFLMCHAQTPSNFTERLYRLEQQNQEAVLSCKLTGTVYKTKKTGYGMQYYLKDVSVWEINAVSCQERTERTILYTTEESFAPGDRIAAEGTASLYAPATNPGMFDLRTYYKTQKIGYQVKTGKNPAVLLEKNRNPVLKAAAGCRGYLETVFYQIADEKSASVFAAMVLGDREELDETLSDLFSLCGIGHILAISGLHISLLGMGIYRMIRKFGAGDLGAMIAGGTLILFYGLMTGNGVSTVRALLMFLAAVYANTVGRTYDMLSAASLAAVFMLCYSPMYLFHCGFLLSYGAVLGIALIGETFSHLMPTRNKIIQSLYASISIQLTTAPIILYYYFQLPVLSVFLNMLVIPLMSVVMISAAAGGIGGMMHAAIGRFCIGPAVMIIRFYEWLCNLNLKIPWAVITPGRPSGGKIIVYYLFLVLFLYLAVGLRGTKKRGRGLFGLPAFAAVLLLLRIDRQFMTVFMDVGQGDGILIRTESGKAVLVDGGSSDIKNLYDWVLEPCLLSYGITEIQDCIVTHCDEDHINGLRTLIAAEKITVKRLLMPSTTLRDDAYEALVILAEEHHIEVAYLYAGVIIDYGDTVLTCIHPTYQYEAQERNDYSTTLIVQNKDCSVLLTGDISGTQEALLLDTVSDYNGFTVLKAAHHGSQYSNSAEFLAAVSPQMIVISCGKDNRYGHPHEAALERMYQETDEIIRTDRTGAFILKK